MAPRRRIAIVGTRSANARDAATALPATIAGHAAPIAVAGNPILAQPFERVAGSPGETRTATP